MVEALLHDGTAIPVLVSGDGRGAPHPCQREAAVRAGSPDHAGVGRGPGPRAQSGVGPRAVLSGNRGRLRGPPDGAPAPYTLTPENVTANLLAIADAARAETFGYYGYSWPGLCGLQLAIRTNRLWALIMGGFPPREGPYKSMLAVTRAAHSAAARSPEQSPEVNLPVKPGDWDAATIQTNETQTRQFLTLYEALQDFDDFVRLAWRRICPGWRSRAPPITSLTDPAGGT